MVGTRWSWVTAGRFRAQHKTELLPDDNDPGPKNDKGLALLIPVIVDVMTRDNEQIARRFGLVNGKTKEELIADAMKECAEAKQAVLLGVPEHQKLKEVSEGIASLFRLMPEQVGPLMTMVTSMLGVM